MLRNTVIVTVYLMTLYMGFLQFIEILSSYFADVISWKTQFSVFYKLYSNIFISLSLSALDQAYIHSWLP